MVLEYERKLANIAFWFGNGDILKSMSAWNNKITLKKVLDTASHWKEQMANIFSYQQPTTYTVWYEIIVIYK